MKKLRESLNLIRQFSTLYNKNLKALQLCLILNQYFINDMEIIYKIQKFIERERLFIKNAHK